jgi:hypothetical protein
MASRRVEKGRPGDAPQQKPNLIEEVSVMAGQKMAGGLPPVFDVAPGTNLTPYFSKTCSLEIRALPARGAGGNGRIFSTMERVELVVLEPVFYYRDISQPVRSLQIYPNLI